MHSDTYFDLQLIEIALLAAVLVSKVSKKDCSEIGDTTNDDIDLVSRAQCIAIQTISNCKIESYIYGQDEVSFWR